MFTILGWNIFEQKYLIFLSYPINYFNNLQIFLGTLSLCLYDYFGNCFTNYRKIYYIKIFGIFILTGWELQNFLLKKRLYISKPIAVSLFFVAWSLISSLWTVNSNAFLTGFITLYKIQINE